MLDNKFTNYLFFHMHHLKYYSSDVLAVISGASTIAAWQEQLDWTLRILASITAITAAIYSILIRKKSVNASDVKKPDDK